MKIILVPDSFKGTLSSTEVSEVMKDAIIKIIPDAEVKAIPVADGGEGTVDAFLAAVGGEKITLSVSGPYNEKCESFYGIIREGKTAVIEMAAAAGLPMVGDNKNPLITTTFGVGELMADAISKGVSEIILALGGSATNDGGCGAAAALGAEFYDSEGNMFVPVGGTLSNISEIKTDKLCENLKDVKVTVMCDIDNPLYGKTGAAYVFAPQKGADENQVKLLNEGLINFSKAVEGSLGVDISKLSGAGAAGGFGGGAAAFFKGELVSGTDVVLNTAGFDKELERADLVITGEGRIDSQSIRGKVVSGVAKRVKPFNIPLIVIAGAAEEDIDQCYDMGVTAVFSINRKAEDFSVSRYKSKENLYKTTENIIRLINFK